MADEEKERLLIQDKGEGKKKGNAPAQVGCGELRIERENTLQELHLLRKRQLARTRKEAVFAHKGKRGKRGFPTPQGKED